MAAGVHLTRTLPIYTLAPPGTAFLPGVLEPLNLAGSFSSIEELFAANGGKREPGWVLLPSKADAAFLLEAALRLSREPGVWTPLLIEERTEGVVVLPLQIGFEEKADRAFPRLRGEGPTGLLSLPLLLQELSRIRHDINNPLTAALAEIQLLLMDVQRGTETEEALTVVEAQLHRIRDLTAELTALRAPSQ